MEPNKSALTAVGGINQLINEVKREIELCRDSTKQLSDAAIVVNNFILQTLGVVSDNENLSEVNQTLVNSLIQVKEFIANRPNEVRTTISTLEQKLDAYEQCLLVINESIAQQPEVDDISNVSTDKKKE